MNCPSCGHPVSQHTDFYCLHTGCKCNISFTAAEARYWAVRMMRERDRLQGELVEYGHRLVSLEHKLDEAKEAIEMARSKFASMDRIDCEACALSMEFILQRLG